MSKVKNNSVLSRRKMLGRIGLLAAASYSVPALTTLSMARASGAASGGGNDNGGNSAASAASVASTASTSSGPSGADNGSTGTGNTGTGTNAAGNTALDLCGAENLNDPVYLQCLVDNGF